MGKYFGSGRLTEAPPNSCLGSMYHPEEDPLQSVKMVGQSNTVLGTQHILWKVNLEDDFPFPRVGYVSSLENISSSCCHWWFSQACAVPVAHLSLFRRLGRKRLWSSVCAWQTLERGGATCTGRFVLRGPFWGPMKVGIWAGVREVALINVRV